MFATRLPHSGPSLRGRSFLSSRSFFTFGKEIRIELWWLFVFFLFGCHEYSHAQAWSGILQPTFGSNACKPASTTSPGRCAIDWSTAGIPGGIPSSTWTKSGATILASSFGNGFRDATSHIQSALDHCGGSHLPGKYVLLGAGKFLIEGSLSIPSNCVLRGMGADQTILDSMARTRPPINMGSGGPNCGTWTNHCSYPTTVSITGGYQAGSSSITVSSARGISAGMYLLIDQVNDGNFVTNYGAEGPCSYCDSSQTPDGSRVQGQIAEVQSVNGTTLGISPPLYVTYYREPEAIPFSANKYSGLENLQIYANNSHSSGAYDASNITINGCAYCWVSGVEGNYTDGDHVRLYADFHNEVVNSYFSNAYLHGPGAYDSDIVLATKTTGSLIQNNILERLHCSTMLEFGAAGNVIAYNYWFGAFDSTGYTPGSSLGALGALMIDTSTHGGHPQFNLWEGNVGADLDPDAIWGSSANNTSFRNWFQGTTKQCTPVGVNGMTPRGPVTCTPLGNESTVTPTSVGTTINGWWAFEGAWSVAINYMDNDYNLIGDVLGSTEQATNVGLPAIPQSMAVCGTPPCGTNSRPWESAVFGIAWGFRDGGDSGGRGDDSLEPYWTAFVHGEYINITGAVTWARGVERTLPKSFYLSSRPSWWPDSVPWPAIGPDVTGGNGPGGYVYSTTGANPAQYCYTAIMGGTDGTGSPLTFDADACYAAFPRNTKAGR
jgi:hypothetical protein